MLGTVAAARGPRDPPLARGVALGAWDVVSPSPSLSSRSPGAWWPRWRCRGARPTGIGLGGLWGAPRWAGSLWGSRWGWAEVQ